MYPMTSSWRSNSNLVPWPRAAAKCNTPGSFPKHEGTEMGSSRLCSVPLTAAPPPPPGRPAPIAWRILTALGLVTLALHVTTNGGYNFFRDEFYYIACGRHLAWGYVDHPPLIALLARLSGTLFGPSLAGLRLLPAIAAAATVVLTGL